ncbi:MAG: hypothetical protein JXA22_00005 [Candidatus Thermoplasmatota archaeon]|nr:hypothetical protein [Candidatus Thermoplasmatota archaeon]
MRLVIDSNRVMAGLIKDSVNRMIILNEAFDFIAPEYLLIEIEKYKDYLIKKAHQNEREFDLTLTALIERISFVPESDFIGYMDQAEEIMKDIDPKDSPFLAVGLSSKVHGIWSEDKDFDEQNIIRRYSTKDMIDILLEK